MTPDNVSWIVQIQLEALLWPSPDSPLPLEAPAVICVHKDTLIFSQNGKSGWFAASETQHFFSNGRTVELLTFGNLGGDAVQAGLDPSFDYIGTISIRGLHATSVKGRSLSEISTEAYLRLPDEAQRTLGDVNECTWLGFAVVGSNGVIKQLFGPDSQSVDVRSLAIPPPPPPPSSLQSSTNAPSPAQVPTSFPSTSRKIGTNCFRKSLFLKYAPRLFGRVTRNTDGQMSGGVIHEAKAQCPLHPKIGIVAADNQHATGTGEDQGHAAGKEEPADDDGSASIQSNENKGPEPQSSITPPFPATSMFSYLISTELFTTSEHLLSMPESESSDAELPPVEYPDTPQWRPGLNIIKTSRPSTDAPKTSSSQVPSSSSSDATGLQAVIMTEARSNNSDTEDRPTKKRKRELSTDDHPPSAHPVEPSDKKLRPEVP
ncbi:hypothetical protein FRC00_006307 [Tulasnella sp. 408]|nr:hypothetical protein FRC00_006307 [Tulasnella sp. 408]